MVQKKEDEPNWKEEPIKGGDSLTATPPAPLKAVEIEKIDTLARETHEISTAVSIGSIKHEPLLIEKVTLHFRFDYNSTDLDDETEKFLEELSQTLKNDPTLSIQVIGHTDNIGKTQHNYHLSLRRAEVARNYLTRLGVPVDRIQTEGKGMHEPLNQNSTDEERAMNRRVEIKILKSR